MCAEGASNHAKRRMRFSTLRLSNLSWDEDRGNLLHEHGSMEHIAFANPFMGWPCARKILLSLFFQPVEEVEESQC